MLLAVVALLLTGCSATPTPTAANTPQAAAESQSATPTPTSFAQGVKALKAATAKMTSAQQDAMYLASARTTVTTGTDAHLIATGHKACADITAGVDAAGRMRDVVAAGYPSTDGLAIIVAASLVFCKA